MSNFDESKHKRDSDGKFASGGSVVDKYPNETRRLAELSGANKTVSQKIASVKIERGKDSILPELNDGDWQKIGASKNKPVVVKASIFERNNSVHSDAMPDRDKLVGEALYSPSEIFNGNKEGYHIFAKVVRMSPKNTGEPDFGTVLLDINETNENFEVVHWHYMRPKDLEKSKKKNTPQE